MLNISNAQISSIASANIPTKKLNELFSEKQKYVLSGGNNYCSLSNEPFSTPSPIIVPRRTNFVQLTKRLFC